jgi:FixJ family two-component response regulator
LQKNLPKRAIIPIVFVTGHDDLPMSVQAIKMGSADLLQKPVDESALQE